MIAIVLSERDFDYEIQALVNSFFPGAQSRVCIFPEMSAVDFFGEAGTVDFLQHSREKEVADFLQYLKENGETGKDSTLLIQVCMRRKEIFASVGCASLKWDRSVSVTGTEDWHKRKQKLAHPYRTYYKNELKKLLFMLLRDYPEESLPSALIRKIPVWGTMTGVRPTKIAMNELLSVASKEEKEPKVSDALGEEAVEQDFLLSLEEQAKRNLQREYLCSPEKAELAAQIASKEQQLLEPLSLETAYSLYISIPFCPSTCLYCSFPSYPFEEFGHLTEVYLQALIRELTAVSERMQGRRLTSVYIGGGTPTALSAGQLESLLAHVQKHYPVADASEYTVEAGRPDSISRDKLRVLQEMGVERISVNPQTMQQQTLEIIGRRHTVMQAKEAFWLAREMGFTNINMDLIVGLPGEEVSDFQDTLQQIQALEPDSVTMHSLVIKRASKLRTVLEEQAAARQISVEILERHRGEQMEQMLEYGLDFARQYGYEPYYMYRQKNSAGHAGSSGQENIGFARQGKECLYNILIMEEKQTIVAVGAGASTKLYHSGLGQVSRVENVKSVQEYIGRVEEMIARKDGLLSEQR